jgi:hypothetical protein
MEVKQMNGKNIARKYPIFSWNSKIGENAIALNFSRSGGADCDDSCVLKKSGICYAMASQRIYKALYAKLERHENNGFEWVLKTALNALEGNPGNFEGIRFFRFSTHGTVPNRSFSTSERIALARFGDLLKGNNIAIHFPVETREKYAAILDCGIQPRLSFQDRINGSLCSPLCSSVTAGVRRQTKLDRIGDARKIAGWARKTGKRVVICPAIVSSFVGRKRKITCDQCGLCSSSKVDTVIYPMH